MRPVLSIFKRQNLDFRTAVRMGSFVDPSREFRTLAQCGNLALQTVEDDAAIREKYRPYLLSPEIEASDWISQLELETAISMVEGEFQQKKPRLKVLVLYGSLRKRFVHLISHN